LSNVLVSFSRTETVGSVCAESEGSAHSFRDGLGHSSAGDQYVFRMLHLETVRVHGL
jgi:hypothetical protein